MIWPNGTGVCGGGGGGAQVHGSPESIGGLVAGTAMCPWPGAKRFEWVVSHDLPLSNATELETHLWTMSLAKRGTRKVYAES